LELAEYADEPVLGLDDAAETEPVLGRVDGGVGSIIHPLPSEITGTAGGSSAEIKPLYPR